MFPIDTVVVDRAKSLVLAYPRLSARDAMHVASMQEHDVSRVMSVDAAFDAVPGLTRLGA